MQSINEIILKIEVTSQPKETFISKIEPNLNKSILNN